MGLVDDKGVVLGEHLSPGAQVGAEKVEVDDDDVGRGRLRAGCLREALAARGAATRAWALVRGDAQARPGQSRRLEIELGPVPARCRLGPLNEPSHLLAHLPGRGRSRRAAPGRTALGIGSRCQLGTDRLEPTRGVHALLLAESLELVEALATQVVRAPLQHGPSHGAAEATGDEGKILVGELVLEGLCGGGDDHVF